MKHSVPLKRNDTAPFRRPRRPSGLACSSGNRFTEYLRELPGVIREARVQMANAPSTLRHLADAIDETMNAFSIDAGGEAIEAASVHIRANVMAAASVLVEVAIFAGLLTEVAREAEVLVGERR